MDLKSELVLKLLEEEIVVELVIRVWLYRANFIFERYRTKKGIKIAETRMGCVNEDFS